MNVKRVIAGLLAVGMLNLLSSAAAAEMPDQISKRLMANYRSMMDRDILVSPIPKYLNFYQKPVKLEQLVLVVPKGTEYTALAVDELNSRIKELGGTPLKVSPKIVNGKYNLILDAAFLKGEPVQGYRLIREKQGLRLAGADRLGFLYASVTARGLFSKNENDVIFHAAEVRDWPDILNRRVNGTERTEYREIYRDDPKRLFKASVPWIKNLFRYKVNGMGTHTYTPFQDCFSPFRTAPEVPPKYQKSISEINAYADNFEIKRSVTLSIKLGTKAQNGNNPEVKNLMFVPWHNYYFSWGRPDLQTIAAQKMLNWAKASRMNRLTLHPVDGGGTLDPELWSERDPASRKMYPKESDRAKADAGQFILYQNVFAGSGIELILCPYPYFGEFFTEEGVAKWLDVKKDSPLVKKYLEKNRQWARDLHKYLPPEAELLIREGTKEDMKAFADLFPGRKFKLSNEVSRTNGNIDDHPMLSPYVATIQTFVPHVTEVGRSYNPRYYEPFIPITEEYMWNVYAPHYTDWKRKLDDDPGRLPFLAEYTCAATWGPVIGKIVAPAFMTGLSLEYLVRPAALDKFLGIRDPLGPCEQARRKLYTAIKVFDQAQKKLDEAGGFKKYGIVYPAPQVFNQYRIMFYGARIFVDGRYARLRMMKEIKAGNMAKVSAIAQEAVASLRKSEAAFNQLVCRYKADDLLMPLDKITRAVYHWDQAMRPNAAEEIKSILELDKQKQKIFAESNVPAWVQQLFKSSLPYSRAAAPITLDGKLSEPVWKKAVPVEHFVNSAVVRLANVPIQVRILYDDDKLYVAGTAERPGLQNYKETKVYGGESFQIFLPCKDGATRQLIIFPCGKMISHIGTFHSSNGKPNLVIAETSAQCKTSVAPKQWSFEVAIPFAELGGKQEKALFAYEMAPAKGELPGIYYSTAIVNRGSFLNQKYFRKLAHPRLPVNAAQCVRICFAEPVRMENTLHASGTGTVIEFKPVIECMRPVKDLKVRAEILDEKGRHIKNLPVVSQAFVSALCAPEKISLMTDTIQKAVVIRFTSEYVLDGAKYTSSAYFPVGKINATDFQRIFSAGGEELSFMAWYPQHIELKQGMLEFEMKISQPQIQPRAIFHLATVNKRSPGTANNNSIHAYLYRSYFVFAVWNKYYVRRSIGVSLKTGKWNKIRVEWKAGKKNCDISLTANGKKYTVPASDKQLKKEMADAFTETEFLQFNALNTSYHPAYVQLKNIVFNGGKIELKDLYAGSAASCQKVFPAAVQ